MAFLLSVVLAGWLRGRLTRVRVVGRSMAPTLTDGSRVLVWRGAGVRRDDLLVFANPTRPAGADQDFPPWLVKRVVAVPGDPVPAEVWDAVSGQEGDRVPRHRYVVRGDAAVSQDSRHFGYVPAETVLGVVLRMRHTGVSSS